MEDKNMVFEVKDINNIAQVAADLVNGKKIVK